MRPPERIDEIMELLQRIWKMETHADMRFFQLIYVLQYRFSQSHGDHGKIESVDADGIASVGFDFFNTEDDEVIEFLKAYLANPSA